MEDNEQKENLIKEKIQQIEVQMSGNDFWSDKIEAQNILREYQSLKDELLGIGKYDNGNAIVNIFSGAGGDDAEDFTNMLYEMYSKYCNKNKFSTSIIHSHPNDHGGYRNITFLIEGFGIYGKLKNESGVHRLVRISPFNSKKLRHTSFSLVEVLPDFKKFDEADILINEGDIRFEFSKAGGPGGQNVNKRETAVRAIHIPTNFSVHVSTERSQEQNKDQALSILRAKVYNFEKEKDKRQKDGLSIAKTTDIEWGNQIRSYVLHPYKMVKDLRTGVETSNVDDVLNGEIDIFLDAKSLEN